MFNFLLNENVLAVAPVCGFFTGHMLVSLKNNVLDPTTDKLIPTSYFDESGVPGATSKPAGTAPIRWKTFLKDLVVWMIIMYIFYLIWAKLLKRSPH
jgi:large-conductance mechanosensitive channel